MIKKALQFQNKMESEIEFLSLKLLPVSMNGFYLSQFVSTSSFLIKHPKISQ